MRINHRTALIVAGAALLLPLLGACGDHEEGDRVPEASPTATAERDVTMGSVMDTAFAKDYRAQFPKLADDIEDEWLAERGSEACLKIKDDDTKRADLMSEMSEAFTANGIKPNDKTVEQIMRLAVKDACPERANNLTAVLAE